MITPFKIENSKSCSGFCCTRIEDISVQYGNDKVLENVNLHLHCGELTTIIGPNGAGKSTLLKALLGDVPFTGRFSYMDEKGERTGKPVFGYVPQSLEFDKSTPISVYDLFEANRSRRFSLRKFTKSEKNRVRKILEKMNASHLIDKKLGALSGGELQRVLLTLALDPVPDLLLLDEPVSGVDHSGLTEFYRMVSRLRREYDLSIILVSHDLDLVEKFSDRVVLLNKTVISSGTPEKVFESGIVEEIFGYRREGAR